MPYTEVSQHDELNDCINSNTYVVVYYGAPWCRSCTSYESIYETLSNLDEYNDIKFIKVDVDKVDESKNSKDIVSIPLTISYKNGKEISRFVGTITDKIVEIIEAIIPEKEVSNDTL